MNLTTASLTSLALLLALTACSSDDDDGANPADDGVEIPNSGTDTPGVDSPLDTPTDTPADTPIDTPADTPVDTPPGAPGDTPVDTPTDAPTEPETLGAQLLNTATEEGELISGWDCYDQSENEAVSLAFFEDGSGVAILAENAPLTDITWEESADNSILMSIGSAGDSQLQSITFTEDGMFTTTDSSIAGEAPGPLRCEFVNLAEDDTGEGAGDGAPGEPGEPGADADAALQEAIEEALNEADGSESSVADINAGLIGDPWSCADTNNNTYDVFFGEDGNGTVTEQGGELPFEWRTVDDVAGLVVISLDAPNDSIISGLTVLDSTSLTADLTRFGAGEQSGTGGVSCSR